MRVSLFALVGISSACAPEPPAIPASIKKIPTGAVALQQENSLSLSKLAELKAQNSALCERIQKQRSECPIASTSLKPEEDMKILGCEASQPDPVFELDIAIPSGTKAFLSTSSGSFQTVAVPSGKQKVNWGGKNKGACDVLGARPSSFTVRPPRVVDLTDLSLRIVSDSCTDSQTFKASDVGSFTLSLNGKSIFTKSDLSDSGKGIQVSLGKLLELQQEPNCSITKEELVALTEKAKKSVDVSASNKTPPDLEAQIARESNRLDVMSKQLVVSENLGCWGYSKIKSLRIKIEGSSEPNIDFGTSGAALQDAGNSKEYTFSFGQNMLHVINDESQMAVFRGGGGFTTEAFANREIQELRNLRIKKGGVAYQNNNVCKDGFLGIGAWCGFRRYEKDVRKLDKILLYANDQLIYEKTGINFKFQGGNLVWPPDNRTENIQTSPAFSQLMARKDCPAE